MAKRLSSVVGIDVGSHSIKIAEIKLQGREPSIVALGMTQTPEGTVDHTGIFDGEHVGVTLKGLLQQAGVASSHAVISIAGQSSVLVRTLEVPKMSDQELKDHMEWEVQRNIPFSETDVEKDFRAFPLADPSAQNMDVVMAISPRSAINTVMTTVKKSGKTPFAIDVEPLGIARTLLNSYADASGKTVCMVEFGHKTTSINIYRGGQLLMPRQVPIGGEMFTQALADGLGMARDDAERVKEERLVIPEQAAAVPSVPDFTSPAIGGATEGFTPYNPFADDEPEPVATPTVDLPEVAPVAVGTGDDELDRYYGAIAGVLDEFVAEVRRSIDYFRSKGGEVDQIFLAGGSAKMQGLDHFLAAAMNVPVSLYDPTRGMPVGGKRLDPMFVDKHRQDFAVAIGNALHICFD